MMTALLLEIERNATVLAFPNSHYRMNIGWIPAILKLGVYMKRKISDLKKSIFIEKMAKDIEIM